MKINSFKRSSCDWAGHNSLLTSTCSKQPMLMQIPSAVIMTSPPNYIMNEDVTTCRVLTSPAELEKGPEQDDQTVSPQEEDLSLETKQLERHICGLKKVNQV